MWKCSYFWLFLCKDGKHWNAFVRDRVTLHKFKNLFVKGKAKNHLFCSKDLSFSVVALRLNFMQPGRQLFSSFCSADGTAVVHNVTVVRVFGTHSD